MKKNILQTFYVLKHIPNSNELKHLNRIMKITSLFILIAIFHIHAVSLRSQTTAVSISKNNLSMAEFISTIEDQTNYLFLYNEKDIDLNQLISIEAINKPVKDILDQVFAKTDISYSFSEDYISLRRRAFSLPSVNQPNLQRKLIKGTVIDERGEPVIGANIIEKGTTNGVITDVNGNFSLSVTDNAVLLITYIGYIKQEIDTRNQTNIHISLKEDFHSIEEVVVVGYGTQKKINLTGSVQNITSTQLSKRNASNTSTALQGLIPGLTAVQSSGQPGADNASIKIRGTGSLNSSTSPLVLIDGIEGDMDRIDINSIESISVLKDAASASIYGSRASNGVILITTKRGVEGKVKIGYSGYVGFNSPTCLPEPVSVLEYMKAINVACFNASQDPIYSQDVINIYENNGADNLNYYDTDWKGEVLKKSAFLQNHSVNISGGSENIRFFANAGYYSQDGQIENNSFSRMNVRLNTDAQIRKWLKIGVDISIRQANAKRPVMESPVNIIGYALTMPPVLSGRNSDGTYGYGQNGVNPIALAEVGGVRNDIAPELVTKGFVAINPIQGLDILGSYSYRNLQAEIDAFVYPYDTYEGGAFKMSYPSSGSSKYEERAKTVTKQYNLQASYEKNISEHYLKILAGMQSEELNYKSINARRRNYSYPGYEDLVHGDPTTMENGSGRYSWALLSYLYRINYSYANRYLLEINGRYDGTSRFMKDDRWGFFPSVSAGWRISEESFFIPFKTIINDLKLRGSYGLLGNQSISGYYPYAATIGTTTSYWFDKQLTAAVAQSQLANERITWEKSEQFDVGLDITLLNQRLSVGFDYYIRTISDMLQQFSVPSFVGMTSPWQNAGSMRNNGWELSASWRDRVGNLSYYVTANLSDVKNKVIDLFGKDYIGTSTITKEGEAYNSYYGYVADGIFQSQQEIDDAICVYGGNNENVKPGYIRYKDINNDNVIDSNDRDIIGNPTPRYEYSFTLGGDWKGLDFSLFFQGVGKKDIFYSGPGARPLFGGHTLYKNQLNYWSDDNKDAEFPLLLIDTTGANSNNIVSSYWVRSGAYLRLKNLVVGYSLPKNWIKKLTIDNVRFYVNCQNLLTISDCLKGYDPESSISNGNYYPIMRTFNFGVNVDF